jgi:ComF family protein
MLRSALALGHRALDLVYPPLCLHCGDRLPEPGPGAPPALCAACRQDCVPIGPLACARCGKPAGSARDVGVGPCEECTEAAPPFVIARAAYRYRESGPLRSVLLRLKHGADLTVVMDLAQAMLGPAQEAAAALHEPRLCPVPLHWRRRLRRGYNQAELLARRVGQLAGLPVIRALTRPHATQPQKGDRASRLLAMQAAFAVRRGTDTQGLDFLLADDVLTTGATASACARALLSAGAHAVGVVTLARVTTESRD